MDSQPLEGSRLKITNLLSDHKHLVEICQTSQQIVCKFSLATNYYLNTIYINIQRSSSLWVQNTMPTHAKLCIQVVETTILSNTIINDIPWVPNIAETTCAFMLHSPNIFEITTTIVSHVITTCQIQCNQTISPNIHIVFTLFYVHLCKKVKFSFNKWWIPTNLKIQANNLVKCICGNIFFKL